MKVFSFQLKKWLVVNVNAIIMRRCEIRNNLLTFRLLRSSQ